MEQTIKYSPSSTLADIDCEGKEGTEREREKERERKRETETETEREREKESKRKRERGIEKEVVISNGCSDRDPHNCSILYFISCPINKLVQLTDLCQYSALAEYKKWTCFGDVDALGQEFKSCVRGWTL